MPATFNAARSTRGAVRSLMGRPGTICALLRMLSISGIVTGSQTGHFMVVLRLTRTCSLLQCGARSCAFYSAPPYRLLGSLRNHSTACP